MGYKKKLIRHEVLNSAYLKNEPVADPYGLLAAMVIAGAVADWRGLVKEKAWLDDLPNAHNNFAELRLFFNGKWCALLMQTFEIEPAHVLAVLEAELAAAMQEHRKRGKKK